MSRRWHLPLIILLALPVLSCTGWPNYFQQLTYLDKKFTRQAKGFNLRVERRPYRPKITLMDRYVGKVGPRGDMLTVHFVTWLDRKLYGRCSVGGIFVNRKWICHWYIQGRTLYLVRPHKWCDFCKWHHGANRGPIYKFRPSADGRRLSFVASAKIIGPRGYATWKVTPARRPSALHTVSTKVFLKPGMKPKPVKLRIRTTTRRTRTTTSPPRVRMFSR